MLQLFDCLTGALVSADAAHATGTAATTRYLVEDKNAGYLMKIKKNRKKLYTSAIARDLPHGGPGHVAADDDHGRRTTWTTWVCDTDDAIGLPYAARLAVIRRDVTDPTGQPTSKDITIMITSRLLDAEPFHRHARGHWSVENLEHRHRDPLWREDDHHSYLGNGPRNLAALCNLSLGGLALHGITKIAQPSNRSATTPCEHSRCSRSVTLSDKEIDFTIALVGT